MKAVRIHRKVSKELEKLELSLKRELAEAFALLAEGENLGLPLSRPMPVIEHGAHELRIKDRSGQYRVFLLYETGRRDLGFPLFQKEDARNAGQRN